MTARPFDDPETIEVRAEERLDTTRLEPYLHEHLEGAEGPLALRQFGGGHANLTYLIRFGEREWVLRRPPLGPVAPGAHDMRREHRVLSRLYRGYPLAPRSYLICTDHEIIGADFFVMERRHGIGLRTRIPEPWAHQSETLRGIGEALIDDLAALHAVDPASVGLDDLGKPEGYVERQLKGWIERWYNALTPDVGAAEPFVGWLRQTRPRARRTTLIHNDYKLDNTLRDAHDPRITVAVLDWDMCTRGEPMMDLGYLLGLWAQQDDTGEWLHGRMPTWLDGFPTRREAAERYARKSGADIGDLHWYVVFSVFRYAVILQQIYIRYVRGQTHDERFKDFGAAVNQLTERGLALIESGEV
ncbi:MAG TPA: phosphotransferase family protein [Candidatus Elarobacter sp.]|jgi:aminoglycoside phosphotransferase (APT) family kinase protein|nr:phosphotransferase family protein [Candidatus Elarobacter sp.]